MNFNKLKTLLPKKSVLNKNKWLLLAIVVVCVGLYWYSRKNKENFTDKVFSSENPNIDYLNEKALAKDNVILQLVLLDQDYTVASATTGAGTNMVSETWGDINGYFDGNGTVLSEYFDKEVKNQPDEIIIDTSESMVLSNKLTLFLPNAITLAEGGECRDSLNDGSKRMADVNVEDIKKFIKDVYTNELKPLFPFLEFDDGDIVECPIGLADVEGLANMPQDEGESEGESEGQNSKDRLRGERCLYSGLYDKIEKREGTVVDSNQGFPYLQYSVEGKDKKGQTGLLTDQFQINRNEVSQKYEIKSEDVVEWVTKLRTQNLASM